LFTTYGFSTIAYGQLLKTQQIPNKYCLRKARILSSQHLNMLFISYTLVISEFNIILGYVCLSKKIMKTDFIPKLVGTVTACCAVHLVVALSDRLLTVKALASVGYFEAQVSDF